MSKDPNFMKVVWCVVHMGVWVVIVVVIWMVTYTDHVFQLTRVQYAIFLGHLMASMMNSQE